MALAEKNNVFLIDWLSVTFHDQTVFGVQLLLGMDASSIPWEQKQSFKNGYPMTTYFNHIAIRWGADDPKYYRDDAGKSAAEKVRTDMGISLDMSGQGCRCFEEHGHGDWLKLLRDICDCCGRVSITRLDLAYDDHIGILDIHQIERDARDRNLLCKARKVLTVWSDDWDEDIQGITVQIGSKKSDVLIRIYDKAAERGFDHDRHWIRVELQLRHDRAVCAAADVLKNGHVGRTAAGILHTYCTFRTPTADTNKSRWPMAPYWDKLIQSMEKIRLVISSGEPYNFSKTLEHMKIQYGQAFLTYFRMYGLGSFHGFIRELEKCFPALKPKYENAISEYKLWEAEQQREKEKARKFYGFQLLDHDDPLAQLDMVDIFGTDLSENFFDEVAE